MDGSMTRYLSRLTVSSPGRFREHGLDACRSYGVEHICNNTSALDPLSTIDPARLTESPGRVTLVSHAT